MKAVIIGNFVTAKEWENAFREFDDFREKTRSTGGKAVWKSITGFYVSLLYADRIPAIFRTRFGISASFMGVLERRADRNLIDMADFLEGLYEWANKAIYSIQFSIPEQICHAGICLRCRDADFSLLLLYISGFPCSVLEPDVSLM